MSALLLPIYILIFIGLIYLVGVRPQQKRRKQLAEILGNLRPGDEVVTVVAEDTDFGVAKASIARMVGGHGTGSDVSAAADADAT